MSQFIEKIEERRGGRSIRRFAMEELGINHSLWSRIVRGERKPSERVINAALARWPELAYWLVEDAKQAAKSEGHDAT